ncbi:PEP-CTERM sorting domain-containing protein [Methylophilus sp. 'Pure River']|uniref:PEP-CTERM sorting domain-containing protein n=1 Tax=Methylophilus sp. 'Pure River' TaxID=3377117 RepID=UPI00398EC8F4
MNKHLPTILLGLLAATFIGNVSAATLTHESISIVGSGGLGGAGSTASDMIFSSYSAVDGWGWAGGAGGVQGNLSKTNTGGNALAANEAFSFNIGSIVESLNTTYGAGNWNVANASLSFTSSYSVQNNSRFGIGSGTFDIYWMGNDDWAQSKGTPTDRQLNPVYASNATALQSWAGSTALLGSETFAVPVGGSGYVSLSYSLASDSSFFADILSASATGTNKETSFYLMSTADTLGMIIFTGGQGQALPTLSFDVVSVTPVPESESISLLLAGLGVIGATVRRRRV